MSSKVTQPPWFKPAPPAPGPVLKIYNSLTRNKEEFVPIQQNHITWYCCGPTVYNHAHMGHARNYVCLDICRRILQDYFGYNVKFVQNVTDVDDKIIVAARQEHLFESFAQRAVDESLLEETREYLNEYIDTNIPEYKNTPLDSIDVAALGTEKPKLPMHVAAVKAAQTALESRLESFMAQVKDVVMPALDKRHGHTVTDPSVFRKLAAFWEKKFNEDMARLNVLPSTVTTRVSEYIPEIVAFVEQIIENGFAYATADGLVYFDTVRFEKDPKHEYAKLQPWNKGSLELINDGEGSLSLGNTHKKSSADFALWKALKPGEPAWPSRWGPGRPGWHIECSVMASDILGPTIDIHSGGVDLCFPHHDNELAQLEAYFDSRQWINYFMHNGHLHIQGQKMSKSLKNFITIEDALRTYLARQLRLAFALGNWDRPIDFKDALIAEVRNYEASLSKFFTVVRALRADAGELSVRVGARESELLQALEHAQKEAHAALCDNLSLPGVLRAIADLVSSANTYIQSNSDVRIEPLVAVTKWVVKTLRILGFQTRSDEMGWAEGEERAASTEETAMPFVKALAQFRDTVREMAINKAHPAGFLEACDKVRTGLIDLGVALDDRPTGAALVKFLNEQEKADLARQQQQREQQAQEKARKKQQQAAANAKKEEERVAKMKVSPLDMFKDAALYAEWDEGGLPTRTAAGEEVSKSMRKKLAKQQQQQEKLHQEYLNRVN